MSAPEELMDNWSWRVRFPMLGRVCEYRGIVSFRDNLYPQPSAAWLDCCSPCSSPIGFDCNGKILVSVFCFSPFSLLLHWQGQCDLHKLLKMKEKPSYYVNCSFTKKPYTNCKVIKSCIITTSILSLTNVLLFLNDFVRRQKRVHV